MRRSLKKRMFLWIVAVVTGLIMLGGCSVQSGLANQDEDKAFVEKAISHFHQSYNESKNGAGFAEATMQMQRSAENAQRFERLVTIVKPDFGAFQTMIEQRFFLSQEVPVRAYGIGTSAFAGTEATEIFVFVKLGNQLKLENYKIERGKHDLKELEERLKKDGFR